MNKELSVYIHVPFCVKKCKYCDFLSSAGQERAGEYFATLGDEIRLKADEFSGRSLSTVFFGGGTPSYPAAEYIERVMRLLKEYFTLDDDCEITMEANPDSLTKEKLIIYRAAGINRLSMGLQSDSRELLSRLGRVHSYERFLEAFRDARSAGFSNINVDLMFGLPGQSLADYEKTLRTVSELQSEHISCYGLIVEEGTPLYLENPKDLPDEETERRMFRVSGELLSQYGYRQYEISNFAREGFECRHNIVYWKRGEYLGLGLGAHSFTGGERYHITEDFGEYISRDFSKRGTEVLTPRDEYAEFFFLGLRMNEGVSLDEFQKCFGVGAEEIFAGQLEKLKSDKLIVQEDSTIKLTAYGTDISNRVFAEFI